jgi:hypothetical protein
MSGGGPAPGHHLERNNEGVLDTVIMSARGRCRWRNVAVLFGGLDREMGGAGLVVCALAAGAVLCNACTKPAPAPDPIVFEISVYHSWRGIRSWHGRVITGSENVYEFHGSPEKSEPIVGHMEGLTEEAVWARYPKPMHLVEGVEARGLVSRWHTAEALEQDALLSRSSDCRSSGRTLAWVRDPTSDTYRSVVVAARGDYVFRNAAPETQALVDWLSQFGLSAIQPCFDDPAPCDPVACKPGNPWCSRDPYRDVTHCPEVSDCAACGGTCVIDRRGLRHCVKATCTSGCDCDVSTCAAGQTWCRAGGREGLTCARP